MAVAIQLDFKGATLEQYDQVSELVGLLMGGPMPPGGMFHWVAATDDGIRIVGVWENREAFEAHLEELVLPNYRKVGVSDRPTVEYFEVHNYLGSGRWRV